MFIEDCTSQNQALGLGESALHVSNGIIRMDMALGRGINIKLAKDAHVMIKMDDIASFTMLDMNQLMGRGCRSQGHGEGSIYIPKRIDGISVMKQIAANDAKKSQDDIPVLMKLFKNCRPWNNA